MVQIDLERVRLARERLAAAATTTPLLPSQQRKQLWLKAESLQTTGSFKIRPAFNQLADLSPSAKARGAVTSSSGNFAQGAAWAARALGLSIKIVMMPSANSAKVEATRGYGGEVVFCEDRFEAREELVAKIREEEGRLEVHPYDSVLGIEGNGTIALELLEQNPGLKQVVVPISGGGLIAGIASVIKELKPVVRVVGVQPTQSDACYQSFREGKRVRGGRPRTIADGLMATQPGSLTFEYIQRYVDFVECVEEESIWAATGQLAVWEKLVVEPSGAVPLGAVLEGKVPLLDGTALLLSGGNVSSTILAKALKKA